jgi:hypothetical protein
MERPMILEKGWWGQLSVAEKVCTLAVSPVFVVMMALISPIILSSWVAYNVSNAIFGDDEPWGRD